MIRIPLIRQLWQIAGFLFAVRLPARPGGLTLSLSWEHWPAMHGSCSSCGGEVWGYAIGGISRVVGVHGCCLGCESDAIRQLGEMIAVARLLRPILTGTPYYLEEIGLPGSYASTGVPFRDAMEELELEWAISGEPPFLEWRSNDLRPRSPLKPKPRGSSGLFQLGRHQHLRQVLSA